MNISAREIMPYFQPIISIDTNSIYGYEVLGRYIDDDGMVKSLGGFFSDPSISSEDALKVDRIIREEAIKKFSIDGENKFLFINMRLEWLSHFTANPNEMPTIKWALAYGVNLNNIVIEITEEEFNQSSDIYLTALSYYKSIGCRIALDDYGKSCNNIGRLTDLSPDIIKIDMSYIHKSEQFYHYREYLKTISDFAQRLGIEVLYEGIETSKQLDNCISSKGRYYQGFLLAKPLASIKNAMFNDEAFKLSTFKSIAESQKTVLKNNTLRSSFDYIVDQHFAERPYDESLNDMDEYFSDLCVEMPNCVKTIYLCNKFGYQVSFNIEKGMDSIELLDFKNRNWSWRSYFQNALTAIGGGQKSFLTTAYRDATTKEKIYTYVRAIKNDTYMFIDISKDGL